jgi:hypothetical protein
MIGDTTCNADLHHPTLYFRLISFSLQIQRDERGHRASWWRSIMHVDAVGDPESPSSGPCRSCTVKR